MNRALGGFPFCSTLHRVQAAKWASYRAVRLMLDNRFRRASKLFWSEGAVRFWASHLRRLFAYGNAGNTGVKGRLQEVTLKSTLSGGQRVFEYSPRCSRR